MVGKRERKMSYSRWGSSRWYTFWCASDAKKRADEVFDICAEKSFTYGELLEDIDSCIEVIRSGDKKCTEAELEELKGYMENFIADIQEKYPKTPSEKYKDGEINIEEAFIGEL